MQRYSHLLISPIAAACLLISVVLAGEQKSFDIPLWENGAPGANGKEAKDIPLAMVRLPASDTPTGALVTCPGGGYGGLAMVDAWGQILFSVFDGAKERCLGPIARGQPSRLRLRSPVSDDGRSRYASSGEMSARLVMLVKLKGPDTFALTQWIRHRKRASKMGSAELAKSFGPLPPAQEKS